MAEIRLRTTGLTPLSILHLWGEGLCHPWTLCFAFILHTFVKLNAPDRKDGILLMEVTMLDPYQLFCRPACLDLSLPAGL